MAKKLTVAVLVLFALLYSMIVPSPSDYEYDITKGLGPQALYYYKMIGGKNGGYHQVSNLVFDTGQVYPPPRKPTILPKNRKRKKRKRKPLPLRVERVFAKRHGAASQGCREQSASESNAQGVSANWNGQTFQQAKSKTNCSRKWKNI